MSSMPPQRKAALRHELETIVGGGGVLSDPEELLVYESDGLTLFRALADFVVFPRSAEDVAAVVKLANREQLPFVARGAGTGLSGGCLPAEGGLVLSLMRMNRVLEVDYDNQVAVVEPGLVNLHLSWAVGPRGYYYAPDPSSQQACTIGGNIANNSGGPHTLKYGVTVNHVLGLEVVMPDGEIVWLGGRTRDALGYDLTGIFVGSEGTFGIATKIVVRIMKKPQAVTTVLAVFDQVDHASAAVSSIVGAFVLWHAGRGDLGMQIALVVFAASLIALYSVSSLYHSFPWEPEWKRRMQRIDHSMIYLVVAGTYTPIAMAVSKSTSNCS